MQHIKIINAKALISSGCFVHLEFNIPSIYLDGTELSPSFMIPFRRLIWAFFELLCSRRGSHLLWESCLQLLIKEVNANSSAPISSSPLADRRKKDQNRAKSSFKVTNFMTYKSNWRAYALKQKIYSSKRTMEESARVDSRSR